MVAVYAHTPGRKRIFCRLSFLTLCVAVAAPIGFAADWPGFRGQNVDARSTERELFTSRTLYGLEVEWRTPIGSGYAGAAVANGYVVTAFSDETDDVVIALDETTGKERWRFAMDKTYVGHDGSHTGPISTPLIEGDRVFALAPRGRLFALQLKTGSRIWTTDLAADHGAKKPHYGFATSPLVMDGVLVVPTGAEEGAIAGFDPATGKRQWAIGEDGFSYQSAIRLTLFGKRQIVLAGNKKLFGLDAGKGKTLWEYEHGGGGPRGAGSLTPIPTGESSLFMTHKDEAATVVQLQEEGDTVKISPVWENGSFRNSYNVPVYHDGHVYGYSSRFLTCADTKTGETKWRSRQPGDGFTIMVDGHVIIVTKKGGVHVVKADPDKYVEVAGLHVFDDLAWSPPSFANGHIIARGLKEIVRIRIAPLDAVAVAKEAGADTASAGESPFDRFLNEVAAAPDRTAVVDRFMAENKSFPVVEKDHVHFVYRGPGKDLAIGSDIFGSRQERAMTRVEGTDFFYCTAPLESDARANYVFIRDFEDHLTDPLNPRKTKTSIYGKEMEMSFDGSTMDMSWFAMPDWTAPDFLHTPDASRQGRLEAEKLDSKLLEAEVPFDVYLPAGYDKTQARYPVAYIHGGKMAREVGELPRALDNLIGSKIRPIIAVFIDFQPPFGPNKYHEMVGEELIPLIDKQYRTQASREARASIAVGMTGASGVLCVLQNPDAFSKLGGQSPYVFDSTLEQITGVLEKYEGSPVDVYIDWGKYDLRSTDESWDVGAYIAELADTFKKNGHKVSGGQVHDGTGWSSWSTRTDKMFVALFPM